jgi:hypothetical protein
LFVDWLPAHPQVFQPVGCSFLSIIALCCKKKTSPAKRFQWAFALMWSGADKKAADAFFASAAFCLYMETNGEYNRKMPPWVFNVCSLASLPRT